MTASSLRLALADTRGICSAVWVTLHAADLRRMEEAGEIVVSAVNAHIFRIVFLPRK